MVRPPLVACGNVGSGAITAVNHPKPKEEAKTKSVLSLNAGSGAITAVNRLGSKRGSANEGASGCVSGASPVRRQCARGACVKGASRVRRGCVSGASVARVRSASGVHQGCRLWGRNFGLQGSEYQYRASVFVSPLLKHHLPNLRSLFQRNVRAHASPDPLDYR